MYFTRITNEYKKFAMNLIDKTVKSNGSYNKVSTSLQTLCKTATHRVHVISLRLQVADNIPCLSSPLRLISDTLRCHLADLVPQFCICPVGVRALHLQLFMVLPQLLRSWSAFTDLCMWCQKLLSRTQDPINNLDNIWMCVEYINTWIWYQFTILV